MKIACAADISFSSPGGDIDRVGKQAGEQWNMPAVKNRQTKKTGRRWEGVSKKGEMAGRKGFPLFASTPTPAPYFLHLRAALFRPHGFFWKRLLCKLGRRQPISSRLSISIANTM